MAKEIRNENCQLCSLHGTATSVCLIGSGPTPCDIMIIGEAPGYMEDDIGKPFQGKAGKLLDEMLSEAGIRREEVYITNVVHCRPPDNRTPTQKEITACSNAYLGQEIELVKPKYILLLGAVALKGVLKKGGVIKHRGEIIEKDGIHHMITLHPAALFRQPQQTAYVKADILRFAKLIRNELATDKELNWTLVNNPGKLRTCIDKLREVDVVAYDLETSCLDPLDPKGKIYCIGLAQEDRQWVIPLHYPGSNLSNLDNKIIRLLKSVLQGKKLVAHNGKFDNKWLKVKYDWEVEQTFDTMLASYILDENSPNGLKPLSKMYFNASDYEIPQPVKTDEVSLVELAKYCAFDVFYTLKLYHLYKAQLKKDKQLVKLFKYLLMPASKALTEVELDGIYLDPVKFKFAKEELENRIAKNLKDLKRYSGGIDINWNSAPQVSKFLFNDLKLPILETTGTGAPSVSSEFVLPRLKDKHPVIEYILEYKRNKKLHEFIVGWENHLDDNSFIHPNFLIHGTVTGRLSCRNPNLQQVPRDPLLRSILTAPPGWVFFEADYSQIELRVAAMISGDLTMKRAYQVGEDVHRKTAAKVMEVSPDQVSKEDRKKAKAVNFGFLYGMGARKFHDYARDKYGVELTDGEAVEFREKFFDLYDGLPSWHERQRRLVKRYGYVRNPLGWKRRLPDINSPDKMKRAEAERQAINSPVQGMASQLAELSMIRIKKEIPRDQIRVSGLVHDAILGMIKAEYLEETLPKIQYIMTDVKDIKKKFGVDITVPLEVDIKTGAWGMGEEWKGE